MGTWTMIKLIIVLVAMLGIGGTIGSYIWDYRHRGEVIEEQKIEIGNLKVEKKVSATTQKTQKRVTSKKAIVNRQGEANEKAIEETLNTHDAARVLKLWEPYELQPQSPEGVHPAANGRKSSPRPAPKR